MKRPFAAMSQYTLQDIAAAISTTVLILGLIALSLLEKEVPDAMNGALGASTTWLFIRSAAAAERHNRENP